MSRLDISGNSVGEIGAVSISKCIGKVDNLGLNRCKISGNALDQFSLRIKSLENPVSYNKNIVNFVWKKSLIF